MSYRGRLTAEAQHRLRGSTTPATRELIDDQIEQLHVDDIDVSPTTPDTFLVVECSLPVPDGHGVVKVTVVIDQLTALRILFNAPLDETNVPREPRRSSRAVTSEVNQRVYDTLRRSADDQR